MKERVDIVMLKNRLARLRRDLRLLTLVAGLATVIVTVVASCYLSLLIDWLAHMDVSQRSVLLGLSLIALAWVTLKFLIAPMKASLNEDALCLQVERKNPELGTQMISALQLDRMDNLADRGYSAAMVAEAVSIGGGLANTADFDAVLNKAYRNKRLILGLVALGAFAATCIIFQSTMSIWFQRNLLFMQTPWPKDTQLTVLGLENGRLAMAEGDDLTISVQAESLRGKAIPKEVDIQYRYQNGDETAPQTVGSGGDDRFRTVVKGATESFEFRVTGGDDDTNWIPVRVLPRPTVTRLIVHATPPAYTGDPARNLPTDQSIYKILTGTTLTVQGTASQTLTSITIVPPKKKEGRTLQLNGSASFHVDLGTPLQGTYKLLMVNQEDIAAKTPIELRIRLLTDAKPRVKMSAEGISDIVLPGAILPLKLEVKDDYAVVSSTLSVQTTGEDKASERSIDTPLPKLVAKKELVRLTHLYDLKPLGIKPETHVMVKVAATDNDTVAGSKTTESSTLVFRVVTDDEFREALLRREQGLRLEFDKAIETQKELLEQVRILQSSKDTSGSKAVRKRQQRLNRRVRDLAESFAGVYTEIMNNRFEPASGPTAVRLRGGVIGPLNYLAQHELPTAAGSLAKQDLAAAQTAQTKALARMKIIRKSMVKSETFQQAAKILQGIIERQKRLKKETETKAKENTDDIFE